MKNVKITALRQVCHSDLMEAYENPISHTCDVQVGMSWISAGGQKPEGFCSSAWDSMACFVEELARGGGKVRFGIYACSPEDSSFKADFTDISLTECKWPAHDGQPPDEP